MKTMDFRRIPSALIFLVFAFFSLMFFSCKGNKKNAIRKIDLKNSFWYLECDENSSIQDAQILKSAFLHLDDMKPCNLMRIAGSKGSYLWLMCEFEIPESLKGKDLGFVVSYLRFASKVWINGTYAGSYGAFPPNERNALFGAHFYPLPLTALNQNGKNTIFIKVWAHGKSSISDKVFVTEWDEAKKISESISFNHSKVYMLFVGAMMVSFSLYFLLYILRREDKEYLPFAMISLFTALFLSSFFATELPCYAALNIPYIIYVKLALCCSFYAVLWFITSFILKYLNTPHSSRRNMFRAFLIGIPIFLTLFAPSYNILMALCPSMFALSFIDLCFALYELFKALLNREKRQSAILLLAGFSPVIITTILDLIVRNGFQNIDYPYFAIFGLHFSLTFFIFILSLKYSRIYRQNERLTAQLEKEVEAKTQSLEHEMARNKVDLEMASIVQQKFFPYPRGAFKGWDIAICYRPCAKVSGDLYDYYTYGDTLNGLALFDVSGHGIAASLITMLSKNIIFRAFNRSAYSSDSVSTALFRINREIIEAKGDIENYLTGLLFHFNNFAMSGDCIVEMANAGHPNPMLYCQATGEIKELVHEDGQLQYGAIGIKGIDVSFPQINFMMSEGDILVCFTDGLTEAMNKTRELFGKERVMKIISDNHDKNTSDILDAIVKGMDEFCQGTPPDDDLTVIVLRRKKPTVAGEDFHIEDLYARS